MAKQSSPPGLSEIDPLYWPVVRMWILRLMMRCGGRQAFVTSGGFRDDELASFLGLEDLAPGEGRAEVARTLIRERYAAIEKKAPRLPRKPLLARNIAGFGKELGLGQVEQDILHFVCLTRICSLLDSTVELLGYMTHGRVLKVFSECLGYSLEEVRPAMAASGMLHRASLLWVDNSKQYNFRFKLDMPSGLDDALTVRYRDILDLFVFSVARGKAPQLTLDRFPHLKVDIGILQKYLRGSIASGKPGVNVLIHGRPGTGKTEFVRAIARHVGGELFEVATGKKDGQARQGTERFRCLRLAQCLLAKRPGCVLLFDEVEDVFTPDDVAVVPAARRTGNKAWVNQMLEGNPVPTFWVTNRLESMDPAYVRRFDYVLEIDMPPRSVRQRLLEECSLGLAVGAAWRNAAAEHSELAPAIIERACRVVKDCGELPEPRLAERDLGRVMNNTLMALGVRQLRVPMAQAGIDYRIDYLNADCDLARVREGLTHHSESRICLYGPPGTGKSAFGRHLAQALDRPLLVRRASEVLSPYLGLAERNIARMFRDAEGDNAVLLLDEADSFLQDRRSARHSWEVTLVNEMLTQMETFPGIFIASTNLIESLDKAALRRFDMKIRLDFLKSDQAWEIFTAVAGKLGLAVHESEHRGVLAALRRLTPGDFASVARRATNARPAHAAEILQWLSEECGLKGEGSGRRIGFHA